MGVGLTGLIEPLNGGSFPVFEDSNGKGGFRTVANAAARLAIPANFKKVGMQVVQQDTGLTYQWDGALWLLGGSANESFVGTYYVNSTFVGISTGSQSNPFTTVAAAFAYATSVGIVTGCVFLNSAHAENVTFPLTGHWSLIGVNTAGISAVTLTGNVDVSTTPNTRRSLVNLTVIGNITGNTASAAARIKFENCALIGATTLTASAGAFWRAIFSGMAPPCNGVGAGGFSNDLTTVSGQIEAFNWAFIIGITIQPVVSSVPANTAHFFSCCTFAEQTVASFIFTNNGNCELYFTNGCNYLSTILTVIFSSAAGNLVAYFDDSSYANLIKNTISSSGSIIFKTTINGITINPRTVSNNIPSTSFAPCQSFTVGIITVKCVMTLLVPGTAGGLTFNITYNDVRGVSVTRAVNAVPLNIAGVAGDEIGAEIIASSDGSAVPSYSVTGVVTPGALSYSLLSSIEIQS